MSNVVSFPERTVPHLSGKARCFKCKHEWVAVTPVGEFVLDCPQCENDAAMIGFVARADTRWVCNCGCDLFRHDPNGPYCVNCGSTQVFA